MRTLSAEEVADQLGHGLTSVSIEALADGGRLPFESVEGRRRFDLEEIRQALGFGGHARPESGGGGSSRGGWRQAPDGSWWASGADGSWHPHTTSTPAPPPPLPAAGQNRVAAQQPARTGRRGWWFVFIPGGVVVAVLAAFGIHGAGSQGSSNVLLAATGNGAASSITVDVNNNETQFTNQSLPWSEAVSSNGQYGVVIAIQDGSGDPNAVTTCTITINGQQVANQTATGPYAIASCSAS